MNNNEIYSDRKPLSEEQQIKHLNFLKSVLSEYLDKYSKAAHSKKFANKTNQIMTSYESHHDVSEGLTIVEDVLNYETNDSTKLNNIHIVISRIVHNSIKEIEYNMNTEVANRIYNILVNIDSDYQVQYRDCYSKLAHIFKENEDYESALELYTILANIEESNPSSKTVPARYLLTYCYYKKHEHNMTDYDIASTYGFLDDYSDCGGDDYYSVRRSVENLESSISHARFARSLVENTQSHQASK